MEQHERTGSGIQKAINIREGIMMPQDEEDIEITITDEKIRRYITTVIEKTSLSPNHPLFQELYDFYCSILLQIKNTRDKLRHLLPVQPNEILRVAIGGNETNASYKTGSTTRATKHYVPLGAEETHYHAAMRYPQSSYGNVEGYLEITPSALRAETRHHIHQLNLDLQKKKLPGCLAGLAMTEMVDDMQFFKGQYLRYCKNKGEGRAVQWLTDIAIKENVRIWQWMTVVDSEYCLKGANGHLYTPHVYKTLAKKFATRERPLSSSEMEMIDKAVFDFLSNIKPETPKMLLVVGRIKSTKRLIELSAPDQILANELKMLQEMINQPTEITPEQISEFSEIATLYEKYKEQLEKMIERRKQRVSMGKAEEKMERWMTANQRKIATFMKKYVPYEAPDGEKYHSLTAYCLDPDVIYAEIIKRYPALAI